MNEEFLTETKILNYSSNLIQDLIHTSKWNKLNQFDKIKSIYDFVQNELIFGYNNSDTLTAEQVLFFQKQIHIRFLLQLQIFFQLKDHVLKNLLLLFYPLQASPSLQSFRTLSAMRKENQHQ